MCVQCEYLVCAWSFRITAIILQTLFQIVVIKQIYNMLNIVELQQDFQVCQEITLIFMDQCLI